jgi:co-chaperonin GroES (HSP10)
MQPIYKIFVTIDKRFQDEVVTQSGVTIYKDPTFNPEENSTTVGIVAAIPAKHDKNSFLPDFQFNVKEGDKLYFNFNITIDLGNMVMVDGKEYWMVDYFDAIALVRDGKIHPVGSYLLVEPQEEVIESSLIIPDVVNTEGNRGTVVASNDPEIPVGCEIEYEEIGKFWNIIEGRKLYCMHNHNALYIHNG